MHRSNLARLELRIAIEEFIKRYPKFELADPAGVTWAPGQVGTSSPSVADTRLVATTSGDW